MTQLVQIPPDRLEAAWPHISDGLMKLSVLTFGHETVEDILGFIMRGEQQLWTVLSDSGEPYGFMRTQLLQGPRKKSALIIGIVGEHREKWIHHLEEITAWAKANGCSEIAANGRKAWAKVLPAWKVRQWVFALEIE